MTLLGEERDQDIYIIMLYNLLVYTRLLVTQMNPKVFIVYSQKQQVI